MHLQPELDEGGAVGHLLAELPAPAIAGLADLLEADGLVGQVVADSAADELVAVGDPDLGQVEGVGKRA